MIILRISKTALIATPSDRLPQKTISWKDLWIKVVLSLLTCFYLYCHLYSLCHLRLIFSSPDSQKLFSSPQHAHVSFFIKAWQFWACFLAFVQFTFCQTDASR